MSIHYIVQNDSEPWFTATLEDANGPMLIQGRDVRFTMWRMDTKAVKLNSVTAENLDDGTATNKGKVRYKPNPATDTNEYGTFECKWEVEKTTGNWESFPSGAPWDLVVISRDYGV